MIAPLFPLLVLASFAAASPALITVADPIALGTQAGAISAKIAGVDGQGHTTFIATDPTETLTFVAGADYISFAAVVPGHETVTAAGACGIDGSTAVCTVFANGKPVGTTTIAGRASVVLDVAPTGKTGEARRTAASGAAVFVALGMGVVYQLL
ncbi:hypothetical protein DFH09DRAFT_1195315 [Mycena vulgaris]|nr:hypothetical protein DFH09DRAFT_1195315 [Mycena vulgaris]